MANSELQFSADMNQKKKKKIFYWRNKYIGAYLFHVTNTIDFLAFVSKILP